MSRRPRRPGRNRCPRVPLWDARAAPRVTARFPRAPECMLLRAGSQRPTVPRNRPKSSIGTRLVCVPLSGVMARRSEDLVLPEAPWGLGQPGPSGIVFHLRDVRPGDFTIGRRATDRALLDLGHPSGDVRPSTCPACHASGFVEVLGRTVTCDSCESYELWLSDEWCERYSGVREMLS
jgi:hypothetical protein